MKRRVANLATLGLLSWLMAGCELMFQAGPGLTVGRDEYLKSIKPYIAYWHKEGMTEEGRQRDSADCGGPPNDYIQFGSKAIQATQRHGETARETEARLRQGWVVCMKEKGYRYVTPPR